MRGALVNHAGDGGEIGAGAVPLFERLLLASCPLGGVVLDPFNGSGPTGVAAVKLGHNYIGIDLETAYLDLTQARLLGVAPELSERPALRVVV